MTKTYTTRAGDMWDSIALSQFGDSFYSNQLVDANQRYSHVVQFSAGIVLTIPDISANKSQINLPPWAR